MPNNTKLIQLRVKPELHERIREAARQDRRTMAQFIRIAVEDKLQEIINEEKSIKEYETVLDRY